MIGLIAALIAVYLGAACPRFRWRGVSFLAGAAVATGVIATVLAARDAATQGLQFAITPASLAFGLCLQATFMITFYSLAALAQWSARGLTAYNRTSAQMDSDA
jgi:hypothetical protein